MGKSADLVADEILGSVGDAANTGCVIVLVGLSGTGKGTTVAKIRSRLDNSMTWSNGNIFRSLTLLTATFAQKNNISVQEVVEMDGKLGELMQSLSFVETDHGFDTHIHNPDL